MSDQMVVHIPFKTFQKGLMFYSFAMTAMIICNIILLWIMNGRFEMYENMFWICYRAESSIIFGMFFVCMLLTPLNIEISDFEKTKSRDGSWLSVHNCIAINRSVTYVTFITLLVVDSQSFLTLNLTMEIYILGFVSINVVFLINNGFMLFSKYPIQRLIDLIK